MKLFHSTTSENAALIVAGGFKDATDSYMTTNTYTGVWLSNVPLDENEGAISEALLEIELMVPDDVLAKYEVIGSFNRGYREWLVPAEVINSNMKLRLIPEGEAQEIRASRFAGRIPSTFW